MAPRPTRHRHAAVAFAYLATSKVDTPFLDSVLAMQTYDHINQGYLDPLRGGGRIHIQSGPRVAEARSQVVDMFMDKQGPWVRADWLFFCDSDATFAPDVLEQLMAQANDDTPIVGALAFGGLTVESMFPTLYRIHRETTDGRLDIEKVYKYPRNAMCQVGATGSHCILIHRKVFHVMGILYEHLDEAKTIKNPYPWYAEGHTDVHGMPIGEDIIFCFKAGRCGFPIFVNTGIRTGHVKQIILDEELWDYRCERYGLPENPARLEVPPQKELILP